MNAFTQTSVNKKIYWFILNDYNDCALTRYEFECNTKTAKLGQCEEQRKEWKKESTRIHKTVYQINHIKHWRENVQNRCWLFHKLCVDRFFIVVRVFFVKFNIRHYMIQVVACSYMYRYKCIKTIRAYRYDKQQLEREMKKNAKYRITLELILKKCADAEGIGQKTTNWQSIDQT